MHINQIFRPRKAAKTQSGDKKLMFVEIITRARSYHYCKRAAITLEDSIDPVDSIVFNKLYITI